MNTNKLTTTASFFYRDKKMLDFEQIRIEFWTKILSSIN